MHSGQDRQQVLYVCMYVCIYPMVYYYYTIVFYGERSRVNNADKNPYF